MAREPNLVKPTAGRGEKQPREARMTGERRKINGKALEKWKYLYAYATRFLASLQMKTADTKDRDRDPDMIAKSTPLVAGICRPTKYSHTPNYSHTHHFFYAIDHTWPIRPF
jgi:hypothetical protein